MHWTNPQGVYSIIGGVLVETTYPWDLLLGSVFLKKNYLALFLYVTWSLVWWTLYASFAAHNSLMWQYTNYKVYIDGPYPQDHDFFKRGPGMNSNQNCVADYLYRYNCFIILANLCIYSLLQYKKDNTMQYTVIKGFIHNG